MVDEPIAINDLYLRSLNHAFDQHARRFVEFIHLMLQGLGISSDGVRFLGFLLRGAVFYGLKCVGMRKEGGQFPLKMQHHAMVVIDVILDRYLK